MGLRDIVVGTEGDKLSSGEALNERTKWLAGCFVCCCVPFWESLSRLRNDSLATGSGRVLSNLGGWVGSRGTDLFEGAREWSGGEYDIVHCIGKSRYCCCCCCFAAIVGFARGDL